MYYRVQLKKKTSGFKKNKVYNATIDWFDVHSMNYYIVTNENRDKVLIHKDKLNVVNSEKYGLVGF
jgi:hypothetical protein